MSVVVCVETSDSRMTRQLTVCGLWRVRQSDIHVVVLENIYHQLNSKLSTSDWTLDCIQRFWPNKNIFLESVYYLPVYSKAALSFCKVKKTDRSQQVRQNRAESCLYVAKYYLGQCLVLETADRHRGRPGDCTAPSPWWRCLSTRPRGSAASSTPSTPSTWPAWIRSTSANRHYSCQHTSLYKL